MRKVAVRLMPVLLGLYVIAYLDRVNVTFAQDQLESDLGFSGAVYGFGAGVFFIGYFFFEVPSNLALHKFGARKWIARIMVTWGIISACMMFVQGPASFYAVRFLLGVAEAGFFPGMILYLSFWFPARERARAVGLFMSAIAISFSVGAPLSGVILSVFDGVAGLDGWQWLFVIEAVPALIGSVFVFWYLDDAPADATWLAEDEKRWLVERLEGEEETRLLRERHSVGEALKDLRVIAFGLLYFCMVVNVYGISFWVGEIVDNVSGLSVVGKGFVTAIPYVTAIFGLVLISRHSDRTGERKLHTAIPMAIGAAAFATSTFVSPVAAPRSGPITASSSPTAAPRATAASSRSSAATTRCWPRIRPSASSSTPSASATGCRSAPSRRTACCASSMPPASASARRATTPTRASRAKRPWPASRSAKARPPLPPRPPKLPPQPRPRRP